MKRLVAIVGLVIERLAYVAVFMGVMYILVWFIFPLLQIAHRYSLSTDTSMANSAAALFTAAALLI